MGLDLRDLNLVRAIDEHGRLVRAARVLGMTQPALTRALAALEATLHGPLFTRSPRGVIATALGRAFVADAEEVLGRMERMQRHLVEVRGTQVRDLDIVGGHYAIEMLALVAAARMLAAFPTVRLRVVALHWTEVPRAVHEREASIGLLDLRGIRPDPGLEIERLRPAPGIFATRPGHPITERSDIDLVDILAYPLISTGNAPREVQGPLAEARQEARARGSLHPSFPALVQASPTVALDLLRHSDAITHVTAALAAPALRSGAIVALPWRAPWLSIHPGVIRLRGHKPDEAELAFLDLLRSVDAEAEAEARAVCASLGLSSDCA
jgi:LysR family pca operon transcriptional activator